MNFPENVVEPENKFTTLGSLSNYKSINSGYRTGTSSLLLSEENIGSLYSGYFFAPHSPFKDIIVLKASHLQEAGFLSLWHKFAFNPKGKKPESLKIGPQVLTMGHLEIGFVICIICFMVSIAVFTAEIGNGLAKKLFRSISNGVYAGFIIQAFMINVKHGR